VPSVEALFKSFHKNSTQRKIRRAEREKLVYEEGRSQRLLDCFYGLLVLTRRRHRIPPQPQRWFLNLMECFGDPLKLRVAFRNGRAVAAILTLRHKDTLLYKYGCSDARFHKLGGMHLLFWRSIQEAKLQGLKVFDLGRSEWDNLGLIRFKDRWGARRVPLQYVRLLESQQSKDSFAQVRADWKQRLAKRFFPYLPDRLFRTAGDLIYRHMG
jgi:lipid II:glycine glycyltransferase (peptidoglycan interpeptide bridge formation enzyme)